MKNIMPLTKRTVEVKKSGNIYRRINGLPSGRVMPAVECFSGKLHREDGPAVEYTSGYKAWYVNGLLHREDGPAIEYSDGTKNWLISGELHREDGPAVVSCNGDREWYLNGKRHHLYT